MELRDKLNEVEAAGNDAAATVELDQTRVGRLSRMDALQAQSMSLATNRRRDQKLQSIAAALTRLDRGEYGDCFVCGEPIDPRRLEFDPATTRCIDCAE